MDKQDEERMNVLNKIHREYSISTHSLDNKIWGETPKIVLPILRGYDAEKDNQLIEGLAKWLMAKDIGCHAGTDFWDEQSDTDKDEMREMARDAISEARSENAEAKRDLKEGSESGCAILGKPAAHGQAETSRISPATSAICKCGHKQEEHGYGRDSGFPEGCLNNCSCGQYEAEDILSICKDGCGCMTKTIDGKCGKCKKQKNLGK